MVLLEVLKPRAPHVFALRDELPLVGDGARVETFDKARGYGVAADVAVVSGVEGLDEAGRQKSVLRMLTPASLDSKMLVKWLLYVAPASELRGPEASRSAS